MKLFENLKHTSFFDGSDYDVIAFRYIYMLIIREYVYTFVDYACGRYRLF